MCDHAACSRQSLEGTFELFHDHAKGGGFCAVNRQIFIFICMVLGAVASYFGQPFLTENADATVILITTFTVFAGFLIAIIAIIGDPVMIREGSWRTAEAGRSKMEARLIWHAWLFVIYLVTIGLMFVGVIVSKAFEHQHGAWNLWIERAYLFFGATSFLFTFALPTMLMQMQRERYDAEIARRRNEAGLDSDQAATGT
jgi:hypothetical protein